MLQCILGTGGIYWPGLALSVGVTAVLLWLGLRVFRGMERSLADFI